MPEKDKPMESVDVTQRRVKITLQRARPGEEEDVFVSDGRKNLLIHRGVEVEVPYWAWLRLRQSEYAQFMAYKFETDTEKRAQMQP